MVLRAVLREPSCEQDVSRKSPLSQKLGRRNLEISYYSPNQQCKIVQTCLLGLQTKDRFVQSGHLDEKQGKNKIVGHRIGNGDDQDVPIFQSEDRLNEIKQS
jgi:hypothetical protein